MNAIIVEKGRYSSSSLSRRKQTKNIRNHSCFSQELAGIQFIKQNYRSKKQLKNACS